MDRVLLSTTEVAERYSVTPKTVRRWCSRGYLRGAFREISGSGAPWRIPSEALSAFVPPTQPTKSCPDGLTAR